MARNGSGVYSLPAGSIVTDGDTAEASQHNTPLQDLANDANAARPIVAGGTGATTAADARTNLGLGTAAVANVQTTVVDSTAGRVLTVGAFGLGATAPFSLPNLDTVSTPAGIYRADASTTGTRPTFNAGTSVGSFGFVLIERYDANQVSQTYATIGGDAGVGRKWVRTYNNGSASWNPWREMYTAQGALGTVGISGGIPTGALIERGTTGNGRYARFADGTQICTHIFSGTTSTSAAGSIFRSSGDTTWTFPASFAAAPTVYGHCGDGSSWVVFSGNSTSSIVFRRYSHVSDATSRDVYVAAVNRWF